MIDDSRELSPEPAPVIQAVDWDNWTQLREGRIWIGIMLTLNVEPSVKNRQLLKSEYPDLYSTYQKRLRIITTRAIIDFPIWDGHPKAGSRLSEKYITFRDLLQFAIENKWFGIDPMITAFKTVDVTKGETLDVPLHPRTENNYLRLIDQCLKASVSDYVAKNPAATATLVIAWLKFKGEEESLIPEHETMTKYIKKINELNAKDNKKNK